MVLVSNRNENEWKHTFSKCECECCHSELLFCNETDATVVAMNPNRGLIIRVYCPNCNSYNHYEWGTLPDVSAEEYYGIKKKEFELTEEEEKDDSILLEGVKDNE